MRDLSIVIFIVWCAIIALIGLDDWGSFFAGVAMGTVFIQIKCN